MLLTEQLQLLVFLFHVPAKGSAVAAGADALRMIWNTQFNACESVNRPWLGNLSDEHKLDG